MYGSYHQFISRLSEFSVRDQCIDITAFVRNQPEHKVAADELVKHYRRRDIDLAVELRCIYPETRGATLYYVAN